MEPSGQEDDQAGLQRILHSLPEAATFGLDKKCKKNSICHILSLTIQ